MAGLANASRVASAVEVSSVFVPALTNEYGWTRTVIASATTTGGVAVALASPFVGRFLDRYGSRWVVPVGATMTGLGCIALAGIQAAPLFVFGYAFVRFSGQTLVQFPNGVTVAKWFETRRGRAMSLLVGIGAIGLISAPIGVQYMIDNHGIGAAWISLGVLALSLGVVPSLLLVARRPEDVGLLPDGRGEPARAASTEPADRDLDDWTLSEAARTPALWMIAGSTIFFSLASTGVGFHQLSYYVEQGISSSTAAAVVSAFAFGITFGGVVWGALADRVSARTLIGFQYGISAVLQLALLSADTPREAFSISFAFGFLVGGALSLPTLLLASYYGRAHLGSIAGILQMTRGVSLGSGPLVAAVVYDATGGYSLAFVSFAVICAASVVMMVFARKPKRRVRA